MLRVEELTVVVDGRRVVEEASIEARPGEVHVVLGPNGAGKSSLLSAVMGLPGYRVAAGRVLLGGEDVTGLPSYERARRGLALCFQNPARIRGVTLASLLKAMEKIYGPWREMRRYAEMLGVEHLLSKQLSSMSGGERKRAELLLALAQRPKVLLLDEPDSGVDIDSVAAIADVVEEQARRGAAVLLVTHTTGFLEDLVERGIVSRAHVMYSGRIRISGDPRRVLSELEEKGLRGIAG